MVLASSQPGGHCENTDLIDHHKPKYETLCLYVVILNKGPIIFPFIKLQECKYFHAAFYVINSAFIYSIQNICTHIHIFNNTELSGWNTYGSVYFSVPNGQFRSLLINILTCPFWSQTLAKSEATLWI